MSQYLQRDCDQLIGEIAELDLRWDRLERSLRVHVSRGEDVRPSKSEACVVPMIVGVAAFFCCFQFEDWRVRLACLVMPVVAVIGSIQHLRAAVRYEREESRYLKERRELVARLMSSIDQINDHAAIETFDDYCALEQPRFEEQSSLFLLPWERVVGSGVYLIGSGLMFILVMLVVEPVLCFVGFFPLLFGLMRFVVHKRLQGGVLAYRQARGKIAERIHGVEKSDS